MVSMLSFTKTPLLCLMFMVRFDKTVSAVAKPPCQLSKHNGSCTFQFNRTVIVDGKCMNYPSLDSSFCNVIDAFDHLPRHVSHSFCSMMNPKSKELTRNGTKCSVGFVISTSEFGNCACVKENDALESVAACKGPNRFAPFHPACTRSPPKAKPPCGFAVRTTSPRGITLVLFVVLLRLLQKCIICTV